jgi:hypothetical protein
VRWDRRFKSVTKVAERLPIPGDNSPSPAIDAEADRARIVDPQMNRSKVTEANRCRKVSEEFEVVEHGQLNVGPDWNSFSIPLFLKIREAEQAKAGLASLLS